MEKTFDKAFEIIIGIEGVLSDHPNDKGGLTKYGISQKAHPHLDIRNLTLEQAKKIYYDEYWDSRYVNLDDIDEKNAIEMFDISVNLGVTGAGRIFQHALNLMNRNQKDFKNIAVDGKIGKATMAAYQKVDKAILFKVLNGLQFMHYVGMVEKNEVQEVFFNGWMKRID